jgi:hypothetical protein
LSRVYKNALPQRWNELVFQQAFEEEYVSDHPFKLKLAKFPRGELASILTMYGTPASQGNQK